MKKLMFLAISAILVANVSAQEFQKECKGKKLSKEERVEFQIKHLSRELYLSDQQLEKFANTYREYASKLDELIEKNVPDFKAEPGKVPTESELDQMAKKRFKGLKELADLQEKYYDKFRKDLNARQTEKVLHLNEPFGPKPCCGKHEGFEQKEKCHKSEAPFGHGHEGKPGFEHRGEKKHGK